MARSYLVFLVFVAGCGLLGWEEESDVGATGAGGVAVDLLFVVDNSASMGSEAEALARAISGFVDATGADLHLAMVTTTVGAADALQPGEDGNLLGDPLVIESGSADAATAIQRNLLCEATCYTQDVTSDPEYVCDVDAPDFPEGELSAQYLDCLCQSEDSWQVNCGSGQEEHLESLLLALCRSVDEPPDVCYHTFSTLLDDEDHIQSNAGFLRDDSPLVVVIFSDEGDGSRQLSSGDGSADVYLEAVAEFGRPIHIATVGPAFDGETIECNEGGAMTWGVERLVDAADETGGFYRPITEVVSKDGGEACVVSDFDAHLDVLSDLILDLSP